MHSPYYLYLGYQGLAPLKPYMVDLKGNILPQFQRRLDSPTVLQPASGFDFHPADINPRKSWDLDFNVSAVTVCIHSHTCQIEPLKPAVF